MGIQGVSFHLNGCRALSLATPEKGRERRGKGKEGEKKEKGKERRGKGKGGEKKEKGEEGKGREGARREGFGWKRRGAGHAPKS